MTQIGETITMPDFLMPEVHNSSTCPWEQPGQPKSGELPIQEADEDTPDEVPENLGKKLGDNIEKTPWAEKKPIGHTVEISYVEATKQPMRFTEGGKPKKVTPFKESQERFEYPLQYAPHHLIPGNESLKESSIVRYIGDDDSVKNYVDMGGSKIKKGLFIGYDVNSAENGVWLPSPYALMRKNKWPSEGGIEVIKERKGEQLADQSEAFKMAYTVAAIERSQDRQFHMRHAEYSKKVREILNSMGTRLWLMTIGACPFATSTQEDGKWDPPYALLGRLHLLSADLKLLLIGDIWRPPLYTDALTEQYAREKNLPHTTEKPPTWQVI